MKINIKTTLAIAAAFSILALHPVHPLQAAPDTAAEGSTEECRVSDDGTLTIKISCTEEKTEMEAETEVTYDGKKYILTDTSKEDISTPVAQTQVYKKNYTFTSADYDVPDTITEQDMEYHIVKSTVTAVRTKTVTTQGITDKTLMLSEPDNNIDRLPMTTAGDGGITLNLISVNYTVVRTDRYGVPLEYSAECYYAANTENVREVPTEWDVEAEYKANYTEQIYDRTIYTYTYKPVPETTEAETEPAPEGGNGKAAAAAAITGTGICCIVAGWWLVLKKKKKKEKKTK